MTNICRRSMALLLALVMVLGMVPVNVLAAEAEEPEMEVTQAVETTAAAAEAQETAPVTEAAEETAPVTEAPEETAAVQETAAAETEETEEPAVTETEALEAEPEAAEAAEEAMGAEAITTVAQLRAELVAAAADGETEYISASSTTITVRDADEVLIVPNGMTAKTYADFIVEEGACLTVYGDLMADDVTVYGTLVNEGTVTMRRSGTTLTVDGTLINNGTWLFESSTNTFADGERILLNGILDNFGTLQVGYTKWPANLEYGELFVNGTLNNYGQLDVIQYSKVYVSGQLNVQKDSTMMNAYTVTVEETGVLDVQGAVTGEGSVDLGGALVMGVDLSLGGLLVKGGSLTVPKGKTLSVGTMTASKGTITVEKGAAMYASPELQGDTVLDVYGELNISKHGDLLLDGMRLGEAGNAVNVYGTLLCQNGSVDINQGSALHIFNGGQMLLQRMDYNTPWMSLYGDLTVDKGGKLELCGQTYVYENASLTVEDYANSVTLKGSVANPAYFSVNYGAKLDGVPNKDIWMTRNCYDQAELVEALAFLEAGNYRTSAANVCYDAVGDGVTVPKGVRLSIRSYWDEETETNICTSMTVNQGETMTVLGELYVGDGGYDCTCALNVLGTMVIGSGASLSNSSTVNLSGVMENKGKIANWNAAFQINAGGVLKDGGEFVGDDPVGEGAWEIVKPMTQEELEAALAEAAAGEGYYNLYEDVTIERDLEIKGVTLWVSDGAHLTVTNKAVLIVAGGAQFGVKSGGKVDVESGSKLVKKGHIIVTDWMESGTSYLHIHDGAAYSAPEGGWLEVGATLDNGKLSVPDVQGIPKNKQTLLFVDAGLEELNLANQMTEYQGVELQTENMTITGNATVGKKVTLTVFANSENPEMSSLMVAEDAVLTINGLVKIFNWDYSGVVNPAMLENNGQIIVNGMLSIAGILKVNAGTLKLNEGGVLNHVGIYTGKLPVMNGGAIHQNEPKVKEVTIVDEDGIVETTERQKYVTLTVKALAEEDEHYHNAIPAITWTSSDEDVVDPGDIVDNGDGTYLVRFKKVGTATLTATASYGNEKTDSVTVEMTEVRPTKLVLTNTLDGQEESLDVSMEMPVVNTIFGIDLEARYGAEAFPLTAEDVQWTSSDASIASVEVLEDGSADVTVWEKQHGVVYLTAEAYGISETLKLTVKDYTPRLGQKEVTLDAMSGETVYVPLTSSFDAQVLWAEFDEDCFLGAEYDPELERLAVWVKDGLEKMPADGSYEVTLEANTVRNSVLRMHELPLTVKVESKLPSVTVKQTNKLPWQHLPSVAEFSLSSKAGAITKAEVESTDFERKDFGFDESEIALGYTEQFREKAIAAAAPGYAMKPDVTVTLKVLVEGYRYPVEKEVTIKTTASKLNLVTYPSTSAINTALEKAEVSFDIRMKGADWRYQLEDLDIRFEDESVEWVRDEVSNKLLVSYDAPEKRTQTLYVRLPERLDYVKVTHKVSVTEKLPAAKLEKKTISLYGQVDYSGDTWVSLNQGNITLDGIDFVPTAKENSNAWNEAQKFRFSYGHGRVSVQVDEEKAYPKAGTYTFKGTPYVTVNGEQKPLKTVTLKIKVAALAPKYKLSAATAKLNTALAGKEAAVITLTEANDAAWYCRLVRFEGLDAHEEDVELRFEGRELTAKLRSEKSGKYRYTLYPVVEDGRGNELILTNVKLKLTVQAQTGKISVKQSGKGKLDALNPESQILYTVSKISNAQGKVQSVTVLENPLFRTTGLGVDAKGRQTFGLKLNPEGTYSAKQTYKLRLQYTLDNGYQCISEVKVKVSQGKLKVTAPKMTYHLAQKDLMAALKLTAPENAALGQVQVNAKKTSKALLAAIGEASIAGQEGTAAWIRVAVKDRSVLEIGKTYKLVLDVKAVDLTGAAKTTQVTIQVTIAK